MRGSGETFHRKYVEFGFTRVFPFLFFFFFLTTRNHGYSRGNLSTLGASHREDRDSTLYIRNAILADRYRFY